MPKLKLLLKLLKERFGRAESWFSHTRASRSLPVRAGVGPDGAEGPGWNEQCTLVRERVEKYRDELLRYQLGLERHRRNVPREVLGKLLDGHEESISHPVLYLNTEKWKWDQQRLQDAVIHTLRELGLHAPAGAREPTSQIEQACDDWAEAEAKRQFDELWGAET